MSSEDMGSMVRARGIKGYRSLMRELGVDPGPLLRRFQIQPDAIDSEDALIPLDAVCALLETSSQVARCPDLGLRMSRKQDIGILGPLGVVIQTAATPYEAAEIAGRYLFIHSPGLTLGITDPSPLVDDGIQISISIDPTGIPRQRQTIDLCLGTSFHITRFVKPDGYRLKAVTLPHNPLAPLSVYRQFFGTAVLTNESVASLHVDAAGWKSPMEGGNAALRQVTDDYLARNFQGPQHSLSDRVRLVLRPLLSTAQANRNKVARILALHPRTLHRHLQAEGTTFHEIKDSLRRDIARDYLSGSTISLGQLSGMLGFPEQSALTRACRKWFGTAPTTLRREGPLSK